MTDTAETDALEAARGVVNQSSAIATLVAMGALTSFVLIIAPGLVGAFMKELGLSPQQAGYLISVDMGGMGLATLPALVLLRRVNWQRLVLGSLLLLVICQVISASLQDYTALLAIRFVAGLLGGTAMSVCLASLAMTENPDRNFGFWVVGQLSLGALGLATMPYLLPLWGLKSIFISLAVAMAILVVFVKYLPEGYGNNPSAPAANTAAKKARGNNTQLLLSVLGIIGVYIFYIALSGVWSYLERIGHSSGLDAGTIGLHLSVASVLGIVGALSATALNQRIGRMIPGVVGFGVILLSLTLLLEPVTVLIYLLCACLFKYAWTFVLPYLMAAIAENDSSGRAILITNIVIGGGLATGPAIAAALINGVNYTPVIWLGIAGMMTCLCLFLPIFTHSATMLRS